MYFSYPVLIVPYGLWGFKKHVIGKPQGKLNVTRLFCYIREKTMELMKGRQTRDGHPVTQLHTVVDLAGLPVTTIINLDILNGK